MLRFPTNILQCAPLGSLVTFEAELGMLGTGTCGLIGPGPGPEITKELKANKNIIIRFTTWYNAHTCNLNTLWKNFENWLYSLVWNQNIYM